MNQGRIWTVVKPTVGLPLFLGGVATISLLVHYSVLSHTTWVSDFWQGKPRAKAELNTGAAPVALNSTAQPGFVVSVAPTKTDSGAAAFVVTVAPSASSVSSAAVDTPTTRPPDTLALATPEKN